MNTKTKRLPNGMYRTQLSFSKDELKRATLDIGYAGISLPRGTEAGYDASKSLKVTSFGLWGSSSDNNKFYPGNTANDVEPKEEDFIDRSFRLLTATIVGAGTWKATDFSNVGVLRGSMDMLRGKPVYKDHDMDTVDNWVGFVRNVAWQEAYTNDDGILVPAGINGLLAFDTKTEPKLARGVMLGTVYSNSVTVEFDWIPSHSYTDTWDFERKLGTFDTDKDGKLTMVRRIVTAIYAYHETSMVFLGADPFAKLIDAKTNDLKNIDVTGISYDKANDTYEKADEKTKATYTSSGKLHAVYGMEAKVYLALSKAKETLNNNDSKPNSMKNKFLAAFMAVFATSLGVKADYKDEELGDDLLPKIGSLKAADDETTKKVGWFQKFFDAALAFVKKTTADATTIDVENFLKDHTFITNAEFSRLSTAAGEVATLTAAKKAAEDELALIKPDAELGKSFLNMKKQEAIRLYKAQMGTNAQQSVVDLINGAKADQIEGLLTQYAKGATHKFGGSCKKCGSNEFEFKSSLANAETNNDHVEAKEVSMLDIHKAFAPDKMVIGREAVGEEAAAK